MHFNKMFVSESNIFNPPLVRIRISSLEGVNILLEVNSDTRVDQLKIDAVSHIYDSKEGNKLSLSYQLLHVPSGRVLNVGNTLLQAEIKDNDELLLFKTRVKPPTLPILSSPKSQTEKALTDDEIEAATASVVPQHLNCQSTKPTASVEFQKELRKILVSLIDIAQKLLCLNPESLKDAAKFVPPDKRRTDSREKSPPVNEKSLAKLVGMGFEKNQVIKALRIAKMSEENAIQWLIDNPSDDTESQSKPSAVPTSSLEAEGVNEKGTEDSTQYLKSQLFKLAELSGPEKVQQMLTAFQSNRRLDFKPDPSAMQNLLEMGFEEDNVIDALRNHGNRQEDACEWLLSQGESQPPENEVKEGLDVNSPVYRAILSNHVIQLALSNPKTLIALLQILENPHTMQHWLQDPELSPMLLQISRIYHSEKYSQ